jgi:hypothetical protein
MSSVIRLSEGGGMVAMRRVKEDAATVEARMNSASEEGSQFVLTNIDTGEAMSIDPHRVRGVTEE